jgi:hypothetical protein
LLSFYSTADIPSPAKVQVDPVPAPAPTVHFDTPTRASYTHTTPVRTPATRTPTQVRMSTENNLSKQLVPIGEKRLFVNFQIPSGLEGGEAVISINQDELYLVQTFRESQYGEPAATSVVTAHTGNADRNSALLLSLQAAKADAYSRLLEEAVEDIGFEDPEIISIKKEGHSIVVTKHLFHLPYKVQNIFFDNFERENAPMIDTNINTGDWASFFLAKEDENASPVRSKFRRRTPVPDGNSNYGAGSSRGRPNDLNAAQQQQQQNRNNNVNANNNGNANNNINTGGGGSNANIIATGVANNNDNNNVNMIDPNDTSGFHSPSN